MRSTLVSYVLVLIQGILLLFLELLLAPRFGDVVGIFFFFPAVVLNTWWIGPVAGYVMAVIGTFSLVCIALFSFPHWSQEHMVSGLYAVFFVVEAIAASWFLGRHREDQQIASYKKREKVLRLHLQEVQQHYEKAREEIRLRDEFLSIASHELKTPLTSMLLHIQTALHNIRTVSLADFSIDKLMKMLERTQNQTKRLSKMINDLLNVSLITTGRLHLERESIDLAGIVKEVVEAFSEKIQRDEYSVQLQAESVVGNWDSFRIEQAVTNLVSNALKYGGGKPIDIRVTPSGGNALVIVTDHGIGIAKEKQQRIFHLFERGVSAQEYKGLGVGLYITRQIVMAHGGKITVASTPEKGSVFTLELPIMSVEEVKK